MIKPRSARRVMIAAACVVLTGVATGCNESPEEADAALCDAVDQLETAASDVAGLDANSTKEEAQQAVDDVKSAIEDIAEEREGVREANVNAMSEAVDGIADSVDTLPADATLGQAADAVSTAVATLESTIRKVASRANCG